MTDTSALAKYFKDSQAVVHTPNVGENTTIWQFTVVLPGAVIGHHTNICSHCFIENKVIIGNFVTVKCGVYLWDEMTLEDHVFIGPNATFTNDCRPRSKHHNKQFEPIVIKQGASVGANATVLGGVTIHRYAMVGMGSVVNRDVPAHTLWYGNPARQRGYVCYCGKKLNEAYQCSDCGQQFAWSEGEIIACQPA